MAYAMQIAKKESNHASFNTSSWEACWKAAFLASQPPIAPQKGCRAPISGKRAYLAPHRPPISPEEGVLATHFAEKRLFGGPK